jgi:hypothetical protein
LDPPLPLYRDIVTYLAIVYRSSVAFFCCTFLRSPISMVHFLPSCEKEPTIYFIQALSFPGSVAIICQYGPWESRLEYVPHYLLLNWDPMSKQMWHDNPAQIKDRWYVSQF